MKKLLFGCIALLTFQFSTAQDAKTAATLYNEGLAKAGEKAYVEALDLWSQAIEVADESKEADAKVIKLVKQNGPRAAYGAGATHKKAGDNVAAMASFEKGIGFNPDYYTNYVGKAQVLEANGSIKDAIETYLMAAEVAKKADKADKAKNYIAKAQNIIAIAAGKEDWPNTKIYAEAFLAKNQTGAAYYHLARAQMNTDDSANALVNADKAIAAGGKKLTSYHYVKGQIHEKLGQNDQAISAYKNVTDGKYIKMAKYRIGEIGG